jgi:mitochondrial fission protein ELM1
MLNEAADVWRNRFEPSTRPHIALLVGGGSARHSFTPELARRMGEEVSQLAREVGGSIFVTTSRRTSRESVEALEQSLGEVALFFRWKPDAGQDNPYFGFLALADVLIVTDDSESMVAEACACGKPVLLYPIPVSPMGPLLKIGEAIAKLAMARRLNNRGTERPQDGLQRFCSMLLARGYVRPPRDLERMREQLAVRGLVRVFDGQLGPLTRSAVNEVEQVSDRVRQLLGFGGETSHETPSSHPPSPAEG